MRKAAIKRYIAAAALSPGVVCGLFANEPEGGFALDAPDVLTDEYDREIMIFNGDTIPIHTSFLP